jgi:hypothetical protein
MRRFAALPPCHMCAGKASDSSNLLRRLFHGGIACRFGKSVKRLGSGEKSIVGFVC